MSILVSNRQTVAFMIIDRDAYLRIRINVLIRFFIKLISNVITNQDLIFSMRIVALLSEIEFAKECRVSESVALNSINPTRYVIVSLDALH